MDLRKLKNIKTLQLEDGYVVRDLTFDQSGQYLAVAGQDVRVYLSKAWDLVAVFQDHTAEATGVRFGRNAQFLASVSVDRTRAADANTVSIDALDTEPAADESAPAEPGTAADPVRVLAEFSDERIIAALKSLPRDICWTLLLVDVEGLGDREAAEVLDVPAGTVKSRLHRGRRMLRDALLPPARAKSSNR